MKLLNIFVDQTDPGYGTMEYELGFTDMDIHGLRPVQPYFQEHFISGVLCRCIV